MTPVSTRRAEFMLLMVTVCWAVSFPAIKIATPFASPTIFVGVRFTAAFILMLLMWPLLKSTLPPELRARGLAMVREGPAVRWGVLLGLLIALGYTTQTIGLHTTSANNSAFITALSVVLVPVLLFVFRGKRPAPAVAAGIGLAVVGLVLLTRPDLGQLAPGDLWTVGCAVGYAGYLILLNEALLRVCWPALLFWTLLVCAVVNLAWAFTFETIVFEPGPELIGSLAVTTLFSTLGGLYLQNRYQGYTNATRAALIFSAEPVFAAVCSWAVLGEVLAPVSLVGAALILSAVLLTELRGHRPAESA